MQKILLFFLLVTLLGCSKKKDNIPLDSIGSSFEKSRKFEDLTIENYSNEAEEILEKHKQKLKIILPRLIADEVIIYEKFLTEVEKSPIKNLSYHDTNQYLYEELSNTKNRLMIKEMALNKAYFQLFNELSFLNFKYRFFRSNLVFKDFYDAGPIVLSEEVLIKIDEMVKDEKIRVAIEKKINTSKIVGSGLSILTNIVSFSKCGKSLKSVTVGAKAAKNKFFLKSASNYKSKLTYLVLEKNMAQKLSQILSNQNKRDFIVGRSEEAFLALSVVNHLNDRREDKLLESFQNINNQINGRIGDFSDGILAVHLQKVRGIIKDNTTKLAEASANELSDKIKVK
ncbi:hypothetical protein KBJ98_07725 [Flavobacterium sp. F-328]|uniref:Lipoprotein n=1 Tax=Flavobacterium erciyesense TaxID=2825842 RepID=A0ABS5D3J7_9FLAO|nr:hypothetical protein [Flavobacterium erciyesense]MBQ0908586.1 hypothetical protein [Flavobacterium erciyesense]